MLDQPQGICECEQFPGRLRDLCEGLGRDGRPHPLREHTQSFRERNNLPPLPSPQRHTITFGSPPLTKTQETPVPQPPLTFLERVVSASKAAVDYAASGGKLLAEEQIAARLAICQTCDQFTGEGCKKCGCSCNGGMTLMNKLAHPGAVCPYDPPKWGPEESL